MSASNKSLTLKTKHKPGVLERFLFSTPVWQEGFKSFYKILGKPTGWVYVVRDDGEDVLMRLDRKGACALPHSVDNLSQSVEAFHYKYGGQISRNDEVIDRLPGFYRDVAGKSGVIFPMKHMGKLKALLFLNAFSRPDRAIREFLEPFQSFLLTSIELAYKTFELNNFYETVHPRALALSTMHSVHRVISSSLRLNELLPRIGRLSAQVLKAKGCAIMLFDSKREFLLPYFSFGDNPKFVYTNKLKLGKGISGRIAKTGEFHLTRKSIGVPFIEDDVVGVLVLWDKTDHQPFTKTDLEILKSLSEQAVVAIKNAQLYEETEELTLGSIKTINDLLELNFEGERRQLPVFGEIIMEVGKEMELSSRELTHLSRAILLLDAGTLTLSKKVWQKKGRLTEAEYEEIKRIPLQGAVLLRSISSLKPVIPVILHHRERYDGKGYPQGLKGAEIPIGARIVSVVDSFIAMISERAYRKSMSVEQAVSEIEANRSTQFDPAVVDSFLRVIRRKEIIEKLQALSKQRLAKG